jgi:hypothetical protein
MLRDTGNPNGRPNSDVVKPRIGGQDIVGQHRQTWIIDFGVNMPLEEAAKYEWPFRHVVENVKPERDNNRRHRLKEKWWIHGEPRPGLRNAIKQINRCIVTPEVSKHRVFIWMPTNIIPDHQARVFARDDDYFFGVLHSRIHEVWARATGTQLREAESGFRYTPSSTFETFPFPWPPGAEPKDNARVQEIAQAAKELVEQRDRWLNPQVTVTFAEHPRSEAERGEVTVTSDEKKKRTLTNLYNARPTWLDLAHRRLDEAVFAAYGWKPDLSDEEILEKLLALNLERAEK